MATKFIKHINVIVLASFVFSLNAPSNQSLTNANLFHNGISYLTETLQTPSYYVDVFQNTTILIEMVGMRINYLHCNDNLSYGFVRNVFKTKLM